MEREILTLYFVAGSQDVRHLAGDAANQLLQVLEQALRGGITCFQFRDKGAFSLENHKERQENLARDCQKLCQQYQVPFIMNDQVDLAIKLKADGIHVGQSDLSILEIRHICPKNMILGLSINTLEQAKQWNHIDAVDYFGVGPIFPTQSKTDHKPPVGIDFIQTLRQNNIDKPLVAIGSVKQDHLAQLKANGANGVAMISAISQAKDVVLTVKTLKEQWYRE